MSYARATWTRMVNNDIHFEALVLKESFANIKQTIKSLRREKNKSTRFHVFLISFQHHETMEQYFYDRQRKMYMPKIICPANFCFKWKFSRQIVLNTSTQGLLLTKVLVEEAACRFNQTRGNWKAMAKSWILNEFCLRPRLKEMWSWGWQTKYKLYTPWQWESVHYLHKMRRERGKKVKSRAGLLPRQKYLWVKEYNFKFIKLSNRWINILIT